MSLATLLFLFVIVPIALGAYIFIQGRGDRVESAVLALTPLAIGLIFWSACYAIAATPLFDWNAGKIAPVVAMVRGEPTSYSLYQPPVTGVMTGWIYGPIAALLWLPAAMFSRPTDVIVAGVVINAVLVIAAIFVLHWRATRSLIATSLLTAAILAWCLTQESLRRAVFMIAPDGPAIAFAVLSCAFLIGRRTTVDLILSATFVSLACWSKQTTLPAIIVAPVYLWIVDGRSTALRYVLTLLIVFATVSTALIAAFGPREMYFHMIALPRSHGWQTPLLAGARDWLIDAIPPLVLLALVAVFARRTIVALPLMALAMLPGSILGYIKVGGFINNFALPNLLFMLAASVGAGLIWNRHLRLCVSIALILWPVPTALVRRDLLRMASRINNPYANQQEVAYRYANAHPGVAYFPWNNLSTLLAEGRLYHFEWGVRDRYDASLPPTPQQIVAHVPPRVRFIAFPSNAQSEFSRNLFPMATEPTTDDELPNFVVYRRRE